MKQIYKILSLKSLILSIFILFMGTSIYAETTFEKIKRTGKVTVGTEAAFPPFEFVEDGKIVAPIDNMRFDDTIYNVFGQNLESVTNHHQLIPNIGTYDGRDFGGKYCPGILLSSFDLTL